MGDALNDGLHGHNVILSRSCEKRVNFIHFRKEFANGDVEMYLFNKYLPPVDLDCMTSEAQRPDLGIRREDSPRCLCGRMNLDIE